MEKEVDINLTSFFFDEPEIEILYPEIIKLDQEMVDSWDEKSWSGIRGNKHYKITLIGSNSHYYGFSLYYLVEKSYHLLKIVISKIYRKRGYGDKLLRFDLFDGQGARECFLEVREDNSNAIKLYEKLGFKTIHRVNNFYRDGGAALKMMLRYSNS